MQLSQIANIQSGYPFRGRINECVGGGLHIVQMKDITPELSIRWGSVTEIKPASRRIPASLCAGDILVAARGKRNYAVLIDKIDRLVVAAPYFFVVRIAQPDLLMPAFVTWMLNHGPAQAHFKNAATGIKNKHIRLQTLALAPLVEIPLHDQQRLIALHTVLREQLDLCQHLIAQAHADMTELAAQLFHATPNTPTARIEHFYKLHLHRTAALARLDNEFRYSQDRPAETDAIGEAMPAHYFERYRSVPVCGIRVGQHLSRHRFRLYGDGN
ncbi:MAG: restriction endonuclease subunit S [Pseudomonadota bacterium]